MNFADLVTEVYTITNRPDLIAETALVLRKATLKMHQFDFFKKDINEGIFSVPPTSDGYKFSLSLMDDLPRFRALAYARVYDPVWTGTESYFEEVMPDTLFNEYKEEFTNCFYRAGQQINFKSKEKIASVVVGWYQFPVVTPTANYSSWIANDMPYGLIYEAAADILDMLAQSEAANKLRAQATQHMQLLQINNTEGIGR